MVPAILLRGHVSPAVRSGKIDRPPHRRVRVKIDQAAHLFALRIFYRNFINRRVAELSPEIIPDISDEGMSQHTPHAVTGHDHIAGERVFTPGIVFGPQGSQFVPQQSGGFDQRITAGISKNHELVAFRNLPGLISSRE